MAIPWGTQRLDHLGLVAGMYEELGIGELLDELIPQDRTRRGVSVGQAVKAMVLNGLGFTHRTLYLRPQFFKNRPTERLIGPGIAPAQLNDDTLGRALDELYAHDVTLLFALLSAQAVDRLGLAGGVAHLDSTTFHVDGDYHRPDPPEAGVVHITPGYSRDHRPERCQVGVNRIIENQARLPLGRQPVNGNSNDTNRFGQLSESHSGQLQAEHGIRYGVAAAALSRAENLQRLSTQSAKWITRVPETLTLAGQILAAYAGRGQTLAPGYRGHSVSVDYAGVSQRWLVVTSVHALQRGVNSVNRQWLADSQAELNAWLKLTRQRFACPAEATTALVRFQNTLKVVALETPQVQAVYKYPRCGRPMLGTPAPVVGYRRQGAAYLDPQLRLRRLLRKAAVLLATNELDRGSLSDLQLLNTYKAQPQLERGFRFMKAPLVQATPLYLKSPTRIMALLMVMTLCLLVYAALEYRLRQRLEQAQQTFPNQRGKPIPTPTMRWIFQYFEGIDLLVLPEQPTLIVHLDEHHQQVIQLLGLAYQRLYS